MMDEEFARRAAPLDQVDVDWSSDDPGRLRRAYNAARTRIRDDAHPGVAATAFESERASGLTFTPAGALATGAVAFFHGGGWVVGSPDTHRVLCSHLAAAVGATVHSFQYRLAPEHPWPAQREDAAAAVRSLLDGGLGAPPARIALAGDSAGAAMAFWADGALRAAERARVVGVLGIYGAYGPIAQEDAPGGGPLSRTEVESYYKRLGYPEALAADPDFVIVDRVRADGAPVYLAAAGLDPILSHTVALHRRLDALGRPAVLDVADGLPHAFMHYPARSAAVRAALGRAAAWVRARLREPT